MVSSPSVVPVLGEWGKRPSREVSVHYLPVLGIALCFAVSLAVILHAAVAWSRRRTIGSRAALVVGLLVSDLTIWMLASCRILAVYGVPLHAGYVFSLYTMLISIAVLSSGIAMTYVRMDLPLDPDISYADLLTRSL